MENTYFLNEKKMNEYLREKRQGLPKLKRRIQPFATAILNFVAASNYDNTNEFYTLSRFFTENQKRKIEDGFSRDEGKVFEYLLGVEQAETYQKIWLRSTDYIYMTGYARRSFRTKQHINQYLEINLAKLKAMICLNPAVKTLDVFFQSTEEHFANLIIPDLIALAIDAHDANAFDSIRTIIYDNSGTLKREIIKGLLMSHSRDAYKMVADLLIAARLQEGLRQSVFETMDEGYRDGFIYMLKVSMDNDMFRFSSFKRAIATWTGLLILAEDEKLAQKCATLIYTCLTDKSELDRCLKSRDAVEIYISLWASSFDETSDILSVKQKLLAGGERYKKLCLLYFAANTHYSVLQDKIASEIIEIEQDEETLCWAALNIFCRYELRELSSSYAIDNTLDTLRRIQCKNPALLFTNLLRFLENMRKEELTFEKSIFPWLTITVSKATVIEKLFICTYLQQKPPIDVLIKYRDKMNIATRCHVVYILLRYPKDKLEKEWLISFIGDKSSTVRRLAASAMESMQLQPGEYELIEEFLKYKSGDIRKTCIKMLIRQDNEELKCSITRLLASDVEGKKLAGLELVDIKKMDPDFADLVKNTIAENEQSARVSVLVEKISEGSLPRKSQGFGLFDPLTPYRTELPALTADFNRDELFARNIGDFGKYVEELCKLVEKHSGYEYETEHWNGERAKVIFGADHWFTPFKRTDINDSIDDYPLNDVWRGFLKDSCITIEQLFSILYCYKRRFRNCNQYESWFLDMEKVYYPSNIQSIDVARKESKYINYAVTILELLVKEFPKEKRFELSQNALLYILKTFPESYLKSKPVVTENRYYDAGSHEPRVTSTPFIEFWLEENKAAIFNEDSFRAHFNIAHYLYERSEFCGFSGLSLNDYAHAYKLNAIDENELYSELLYRPFCEERIRELTRTRKKPEDCTFMNEEFMAIAWRAVDTVLEIEMRRGDLNTDVTHLACQIQSCYGIKYFVGILQSMEKESFVRGYDFVNDAQSRGAVLSHLIRNCYPKDGDDEAALKEQLTNRSISEKRLLEAAMYAPQWISIVERYLQWEGLASACWYFHAHLNDVFPEEKISVVARYSPLEPAQFREGAFDINWFREAYSTLQDKRFQMVYDAAKYISRGANHRRSQLFADAAINRLDKDDVQKKIKDSRNRDYLLAYSIIPIQNDLAERYEFLQNFNMESKKYGAQRRASEGRAVEIALENLARTAGYADVTRLVWNMEAQKADEYKAFFEPQQFEEGVEAHISLEGTGKAMLKVSRNGKELSDIPSALKKDGTVLQMKAAVKTLVSQFQRAREILEKAMELSDEFLAEELNRFSSNPVLYNLVKNLVFTSGEHLGFFIGGLLVSADGTAVNLQDEDRCRIAHSVDLYESGCWVDYQKYLFSKQIVQPFRQVFRELYLPNEDELSENTFSKRYAGYQIQPKKAVALLKTRRWTAGYEEGVQKVYFKYNIAVQLYGEIDWFSPADIEAPALEGIGFFDRRTYKTIPICEVPRILFSEVMRDIDMVVSVAHAGGVDPEATLSTIEMRTVIILEIVRLLKLTNVEIKGSHAFINGKYGEYTVHLGSGIVHKMAHGAVHIIPVNSQQRGRVFLPFIDDDPRTAEITTKILFLSEDYKIKDPSILRQIATD